MRSDATRLTLKTMLNRIFLDVFFAVCDRTWCAHINAPQAVWEDMNLFFGMYAEATR